jgi:hypothetical protein
VTHVVCDHSYLSIFVSRGWFTDTDSGSGMIMIKIVITQMVAAIAESVPIEPDNLTVLIVTLILGHLFW